MLLKDGFTINCSTKNANDNHKSEFNQGDAGCDKMLRNTHSNWQIFINMNTAGSSKNSVELVVVPAIVSEPQKTWELGRTAGVSEVKIFRSETQSLTLQDYQYNVIKVKDLDENNWKYGLSIPMETPF